MITTRPNVTDPVVVTGDGAALAELAPFRHVIDGVGGPLLVAAIDRLDADGVAVSYGERAGPTIDLPLRSLFGRGRAHVRGLNLFADSAPVAPRRWLERLLRLIERGTLSAEIGRRGSWADIGEHAAGLNERQFTGEAVMVVD